MKAKRLISVLCAAAMATSCATGLVSAGKTKSEGVKTTHTQSTSKNAEKTKEKENNEVSVESDVDEYLNNLPDEEFLVQNGKVKLNKSESEWLDKNHCSTERNHKEFMKNDRKYEDMKICLEKTLKKVNEQLNDVEYKDMDDCLKKSIKKVNEQLSEVGFLSKK